MESLHSILRMHWDHEPDRPRPRRPTRPRKRQDGMRCRGRERERRRGRNVGSWRERDGGEGSPLGQLPSTNGPKPCVGSGTLNLWIFFVIWRSSFGFPLAQRARVRSPRPNPIPLASHGNFRHTRSSCVYPPLLPWFPVSPLVAFRRTALPIIFPIRCVGFHRRD